MYRVNSQQGNPVTIRYQVVNADGSYVTQANVTGMTLFVYSADDGTETTPSGGTSVTVASSVFNTMQPWTNDGTGYNVAVLVSGDYLPDADTTYQVEVLMHWATGSESEYLDHVQVTTDQTYSVGGV